VFIAGRYIWRGLLKEERGPFALLENSFQVIDHGADSIKEEQWSGPSRINMSAVESMRLESELPWCRNAPTTQNGAPARAR
jgi:hypothetical protein